MSSNLDKYRTELSKLTDLGDRMVADLSNRNFDGSLQEIDGPDSERAQLVKNFSETFDREYQHWYTESLAVIQQLLPNRLDEFETLYKGGSRRREMNSSTYTIQDWLIGRRASKRSSGQRVFNDFAIVGNRFWTQFDILKSVKSRFESSLFDIKQIVQADLFDPELDAAGELSKNGFLRGGGAIAGVVLEKHLAQVCANHKVTTRKKNPAVNDFNELLKNNGTIEIPDWRFIQRLGDLRNLCDHNKEREPTREEVTELIDGVDKITKTLF